MKILIDAFGGDNAPTEIIKGALDARDELSVDIALVGDKEKILTCAYKNGLDLKSTEIIHAGSVIEMQDNALDILKEKSDSSMSVAMKTLASGNGDALVTAGNSGAVCVGASMILKRIKGIKRPAFAPVIPNVNGFFMLIDGGANNDCRPEMLKQFAVMGSIYMNRVMGVKNPRVALANVGQEEHKGTKLQQEAFEMLKESGLNFIGNIEGRDIPLDSCEVLLADGFTGNIILKTYEGVAIALMSKIKEVFSKNIKNKLAAAMVFGDMKQLKKTFDHNEYGGAAILGCSKPVFKAHGSANARTVRNAVALTKKYISGNVIAEITNALQNEKI